MTAFHPFEVNTVHLAYSFLGGFVVLFGMLSLFLKEKLYIGEAPLATVVGIILGKHGLGLFDPLGWANGKEEVIDEITLEVTRVVIAISVFAVGVELPKAYMKHHWRSLVFLLGPAMIWGWMISALLIWGLIPGLNFLASLVIAACVTPTDPILAQAVVGGKFANKHVPAHIRHLLSAESGSNDGAAFPFLYISLYLLLDKSPGHAVGEWFYMTWCYEIVLGIIIGSLLGFTARKFMKFAERKRLIDRQSYVAQYVSLAVLSIGVTSLLGSDDLLCAFACGCAFAWDGFFNKATEDAVFSNVIDLLFNCAAFIYIGAIIPFDHFNLPNVCLRVWRLVVLSLCVLLLRRLPIMIATYKFIPDIKTFREALFTGWFGPMGVGAIFISTLARVSLPEGDAEKNTEVVDRLREVITSITAFLVLSSIVTHGMSIPFFSLGRRVHSITYTRSRNLSMDTRGDEPAWTTHARRIVPGQEIIVNRDDDEEADLGIRRKDTLAEEDGHVVEKVVEEDSGNSSSSKTRFGDGEEFEMVEQKRSRESQPSQSSQTEVAVVGEEPTNYLQEDSTGDRHNSQEGMENGKGQTIEDEEEDERRPPPLAQYREGNHLVIERKMNDTDEVEVEVIRNCFADDKKSEIEAFTHPHRLKARELDELLHHLPKSLEHATSRVQNGGKDAIDRLGLGLMGSKTPELTPTQSSKDERRDYVTKQESAKQETSNHLNEERRNSRVSREGSGRADEENEDDYEDVEEETNATQKKKSKLPVIHVSRQNSAGPRRSIRSRIFGRRQHSNSPSQAERGLAPVNPFLLAPPSSSQSQPKSIVAEPESLTPDEMGASSSTPSHNFGIPLTRTTSGSRPSAIRFAQNTSASSDTAPSLPNYGTANPGFKKNPSLAMYRSASVQSTGSAKDGPSISFKEPEVKR
nr:Na+/H+ exchanger AnNHA1 [Cryptococcus depauperatus CBS 7841]